MDDSQDPPSFQKSLVDIAAQIIAELDLNERVCLAKLPASELEIIQKVLARYLAEKLKEDGFYGNTEEHATEDAYEAMEIVERFCERLRETHKLRIVNYPQEVRSWSLQ